MATLKEHQAAMVQLLANGSGIPASASRLAHAMHDVLAYLVPKQEDDYFDAKGFARLIEAKREAETTPGLNDKALSKREKALKTDSPAKWPTPAEQRVKELTNTVGQLRKQSAQYRATIAGQKEHIEHLQFELEKARESIDSLRDYRDVLLGQLEGAKITEVKLRNELSQYRAVVVTPEEELDAIRLAEQAGCRKPDTQVCEHDWQEIDKPGGLDFYGRCRKCGLEAE